MDLWGFRRCLIDVKIFNAASNVKCIREFSFSKFSLSSSFAAGLHSFSMLRDTGHRVHGNDHSAASPIVHAQGADLAT